MCFKYGPCTANTYVLKAGKAVSFRRMLALLEGSPFSPVSHFHKSTMDIMNIMFIGPCIIAIVEE